jgi:hypothetical protein
MTLSTMFPWLAFFAIMFVFLVLTKQTFIAQLFAPGIASPARFPLGEYFGDNDVWLRPY